MSERPKFGAGSMSDESINDEKKESDKVKKDKIIKENEKFGAESKANDSGNKNNKIWMIFKSQGIYFWIISYVSSFIIYSFLDTYSTALNVFNLFLFPFALILFSQLQVYFTGSMNRFAKWLAPDFRINKSFGSGVVTFLWYASKLVMYYFVWNFSYILGVLGILIIVINGSKINK